jgi:asparagine synthase (glutamine-hydrolysing)
MHLVFSNLSDVVTLLGRPFPINPHWLERRVTCGPTSSTETPLLGVSEIRYGERLVIRGHTEPVKDVVWNPFTISSQRTVESFEQAADKLRNVTLTCARTWCAQYASIVNRLSGGFDSSTLLGCMKGASKQTRINNVTYFVPGGAADERPWAQMAAEFNGTPLIEQARSPDVRLEDILNVKPTFAPDWLTVYLETAEAEAQLARQHAAGAAFSGDGGDALFGRHSRAYGAVEFLRKKGLRPALFGVAADTADLTDSSVWNVLANALRTWKKGDFLDWDMDELLLARQLADQARLRNYLSEARVPHYWLENVPLRSMACFHQLGVLLETPQFYNPFFDTMLPTPEPVAPLQSQPLVELCLRIPIYIHLQGGQDRALARHAFRKELPAPIREREWKDRVPGYFDQVVQRHLPFIRSTLLDGQLVKDALLNRREVENALSGSPKKIGALAAEVLDHLFVETWVRSWSREQNRAAA